MNIEGEEMRPSLGQQPSHEASLDRLVRDWTYRPSGFSLLTRLARLRALTLGARPFPPHSILRPVTPKARWTCYFVFLPDGRLTAAHEFTLARLRALDAGLLVVCAGPSPAEVPAAILDLADAVCWKGLSGYDFSAYAVGLREVGERSPHADLLILNDSVYGPFGDLSEVHRRARWGLTGLTASAMIENHIQSYCFHVRDVSLDTLLKLRSVMPRWLAFSRPRDVIDFQETRMARIAAATMSVGALWYADATVGDPSLEIAVPLLRAGFPFLKRALFTKAAKYGDAKTLCELLEERGHPRPEIRPDEL